LIALRELGWAERAEKGRLLPRLEDSEPDVRCASIALAAQADTIPDDVRRAALLARTTDPVAPVRVAAWSELNELGNLKEIPAAAWRRGLEDPNGAVRLQVMFDVDGGSLSKEELVRQFAAALHDRDLEVRRWAATFMYLLASHAKPVLPDLIRALEHEELRRGIIEALSKMRTQAKDALPALLALVDVREVRREVIVALGRISHRDDTVEAALHAALDDHSAGLRLAAVRALDEVGAGTPELLRALEDPHEMVRREAMGALIAVDPTPETIVTVSRMLLDSDSSVRKSTAWALEDLGEKAALAVPMVIRAIEKAEPDEMDDYCDILKSVGPAAREALPALRKLLQHEDEDVRKEAQEAIDRIEVK